MAVLRIFKGTVLEENFARTVGSIGESVAAGAIFTLPAFVILHLWTFDTMRDYLTASALMVVGGILGIMFVTVLRRVMVEDRELPFPESVAASEIHKAGQTGRAPKTVQAKRRRRCSPFADLHIFHDVRGPVRWASPTIGSPRGHGTAGGISCLTQREPRVHRRGYIIAGLAR
jgi:uncharacterized oligopeptide transporter (OPT) family protein